MLFFLHAYLYLLSVLERRGERFKRKRSQREEDRGQRKKGARVEETAKWTAEQNGGGKVKGGKDLVRGANLWLLG